MFSLNQLNGTMLIILNSMSRSSSKSFSFAAWAPASSSTGLKENAQSYLL